MAYKSSLQPDTSEIYRRFILLSHHTCKRSRLCCFQDFPSSRFIHQDSCISQSRSVLLSPRPIHAALLAYSHDHENHPPASTHQHAIRHDQQQSRDADLPVRINRAFKYRTIERRTEPTSKHGVLYLIDRLADLSDVPQVLHLRSVRHHQRPFSRYKSLEIIGPT